MKFTLLPAWTALVLAGGLLAGPPALAVGAPTSGGIALPIVPTHLAATGLAQPIGSQVQLSWVPISRTTSYKVYRDGKFLAFSSRALWTDYAVAAGETHTYTVACLGVTGESRPSVPVAATVPAGGGQVVYADALQNGWQSWRWAGLNLSSQDPARAGCAVRVAAGPWQAMYLHHASFSTAPFAAVTFWINGGSSGGQPLWVKALRNGVPQTAVSLGPLAPGRWQSVTVPLASLGVAGVPDMDGLWVQDASGTTPPAFSVDEIALTAGAPPVAPPATPSGLSATPQWAASCPKCAGMAMPHIVLAWNAVPGAASYTVYRDGAKTQDALASSGWTDMAVVSGHSYTYTVTATGPGGESLPSAPASAVAPSPPADQAVLTAPTNLSVSGLWSGVATDQIAWSPVPGAAGYNVYQYDAPLAKGLTGTTYSVPSGLYCYGLTYTVTAVDGMGMESLPSAVATAQGRNDPSSRPAWMPNAPAVPNSLDASTEWNAGAPRVHLTWHGDMTDFTYSVYRDGHQVASGLWGLNYYDAALHPGETHTYTVSGVNISWTTCTESLQSAPVTATSPQSAPTALGVPVQITGARPNDDSVLVSFASVPGARDYRAYDTARPDSVKYSGGGLSIEMNGLDPVAGADLVVEAVDKLGPFQKMDGMAGPGAMQMDGIHSAINGQGDPSDIPNVLASSAPFHVTCQPVSLTGSQAFFDTFRNEQPLVVQPMPAPAGNEFYGHPDMFAEAANDKWTVRNYGGDLINTQAFFMGNHLMDTVYDGCTPHSQGPIHNNNASVVLMPKVTADISGGRVLHVTFEVDSHFDLRRWCDVQIAQAGDLLTQPGKLDPGNGPLRAPTRSGNSLRWKIGSEFHDLTLYRNRGTADQPAIQQLPMINLDWATGGTERFGLAARIRWDGVPLNNGTAQDLDKRHRFDLYLSQTHYRIMESGSVIKDADFPIGQTLPFDKCQVYFVHQLYHTANDRDELVNWNPADSYWSNYRPWCDERHWDAMGQEVLLGFPAL